MRVVHFLEVVEVDQHERERVADPVGTSPFERELLVEGPPVRDSGERVGRGLGGNATEVTQHAQKWSGEHQGDEHEQREGAERRVADALPVRSHCRIDRVLGPEAEEAYARGVGDCSRDRAVPAAPDRDGAPVHDELLLRADDLASRGD
jgi:hypothetical protein